jgi:hypothetical protein
MKTRRRRFAVDEKDLNQELPEIPSQTTPKLKVAFLEHIDYKMEIDSN